MNEKDGTSLLDPLLKKEGEEQEEKTEEELEEEIEEELEKAEIEYNKKDEEENDQINWDGSESEFVEDDDAKDYEEKYSGIKFSYTLKQEEVNACLKHCGISKRTLFCGDIFLGLLSALYMYLFSVKNTPINLFLLILSLVLFILWISKILPIYIEKFSFEKLSTNKILNVEIFPDSIIINDGQDEKEILLDGTNLFEEFNNLYFIFLKDKKIFIIPKRAIEPDVLTEVEAMLIAGTVPKNTDG